MNDSTRRTSLKEAYEDRRKEVLGEDLEDSDRYPPSLINSAKGSTEKPKGHDSNPDSPCSD